MLVKRLRLQDHIIGQTLTARLSGHISAARPCQVTDFARPCQVTDIDCKTRIGDRPCLKDHVRWPNERPCLPYRVTDLDCKTVSGDWLQDHVGDCKTATMSINSLFSTETVSRDSIGRETLTPRLLVDTLCETASSVLDKQHPKNPQWTDFDLNRVSRQTLIARSLVDRLLIARLSADRFLIANVSGQILITRLLVNRHQVRGFVDRLTAKLCYLTCCVIYAVCTQIVAQRWNWCSSRLCPQHCLIEKLAVNTVLEDFE